MFGKIGSSALVLSYVTVFEITLVWDKWVFTRTSKQSFSSSPSNKWKVTTRFYLSLYNAVIKLEEFMSWQCPDCDCHKVTAGFSNAFEVDTSRATMVPRSGRGGGAVSRYYVITTVCQLGHWQNLAQPFDVFSVLGSNMIARKPYQENHWLRQNLLAFKCSSMLTIT